MRNIKQTLLLITILFGFLSTANANLDYTYEGLQETLIGEFTINKELDDNGELLYGANLKLNKLYFYKNEHEKFLDGKYKVTIEWNDNKGFSILSTEKYTEDINTPNYGFNPYIAEKKTAIMQDKIYVLSENLEKLGLEGNIEKLLEMESDIDNLLDITSKLLSE